MGTRRQRRKREKRKREREREREREIGKHIHLNIYVSIAESFPLAIILVLKNVAGISILVSLSFCLHYSPLGN